MRLYATPDDLQEVWLDDVPAHAPRLIRAASTMIEFVTRLTRYPVDDDGYPTDPKHIAAFRDATCQQVTMWVHGGLDPDAGAAGQKLYVQQQTVEGGSVTYGGHVSVEERSRAATTLDGAVLRILRNAGLLTPAVQIL